MFGRSPEVKQARIRRIVFNCLLFVLVGSGCTADPNSDGDMSVHSQQGQTVPNEVLMSNRNEPPNPDNGYPPDPPDFTRQSQPGAQTGSEPLTAKSARKMVESIIRAQAPGVAGYRLTPPLPASFPYKESGQLIYFAYKADAAAGGIVNYRINGPLLEVRLDLYHNQQPCLSLLVHAAQSLGEQTKYPGALEPEQVDAATDILFRVFDGSAGDADLEQMTTVYSTWRMQNPLIAEEIVGRVPALFQWINAR